MAEKLNNPHQATPPPIFVMSGSLGQSGEQLVRKVLAQFEGNKVPLKIVSRVHHVEQVESTVVKAKETGGIIVNTMVNSHLSYILLKLAAERNVTVIDLVGSLINHLSKGLEQEPIGKPGLYRELHGSYFRRVEAIEFTLAHDDGKNYQGWPEAEIMLVGVSRVGKTPISLYLSMLGWKVANLPLVKGIPPRSELFELDRRRVIGLTIDPGQLLYYRRQRQRRLGTGSLPNYADPMRLYDEIEHVRWVLKRQGYRVIDVTNKPIETSADEVVDLIMRRLKSEAHTTIEGKPSPDDR